VVVDAAAAFEVEVDVELGGAEIIFPASDFPKIAANFFGTNYEAAPDGKRVTTGEFTGTAAPAKNNVCIAGDLGLRAATAGLNFEQSATGNDGARFTGVAPTQAFVVVVVFVDRVLPALLARANRGSGKLPLTLVNRPRTSC